MAETGTINFKDYIIPGLSIIFGLASLGFLGFSFYMLSKFLGNSDTNNVVQTTLSPYIWGPMGASISLFIFAYVYFHEERKYLIHFMLVLLCFTTIMSYSALAVSAWQKKM